jgi:hypothetical protein
MESAARSMMGIIPVRSRWHLGSNSRQGIILNYKESLAVKRDPVKEGRKQEATRKMQMGLFIVIGGTAAGTPAPRSRE